MPVNAEGGLVPLNDLGRGIARDREALESAFRRVLDSGHVVMGPSHAEFEQELASYVGATHALGVASGTDALELAIKAAMPDGRRTVLTAANAGGYTSTAALRGGFDVRYADVDEESMCVDEATILAALTDDVGVVVVTHLYGNQTDIRGLVAMCRARNVRVVEDCAQAIGARGSWGAAGAVGDIAAVSFYPTKNLGAIGDGGAVITSNAEFADKVRRLRQYGWGAKYSVDLGGGMNSRLDELQAAFLLHRLPLLDGFNERRREIVARYVIAARGTRIRVAAADGPHHVAHLAVARSVDRDRARDMLLEQGIQTDIHFPIPDHRQTGFAVAAQVSLPVTEKLSNEIFSLPCFPELTDDEVERVCSAIGTLQ